ncbi:hypothetical protein B0J17DRAFT_251454 [Rhizoctonia solani]|nr:hypothetical protein B0J17DRAFT_251454 [Rhizoctonia solani]
MLKSPRRGMKKNRSMVDTHGFIGELYAQRRARIYSWTLFSTVGKLLWTADDPRQFLEAVLDAMLGYWQVVNRGILHRDISDGNVLIAEPGQGYNQRNWKLEQRSTVQEDDQQTTEVQNHPLAESRRLAQETIVKRGQDPSGLLGDFDLAATHTGLGPEFYSDGPMKGRDVDSRTHGADTEPNAKRLKRDEDSSDHSSSADDVWEQSKPNRPPATTYKNIDFRTGTPTFMSVRVLLVEVGTPYEHHFMDDLESFFWLILWCVVQHTDPASDETRGSSQPTNKALRLLRQLDRADSDFDTLARSKHSLLAGCTDGEEDVPSSIADELEGCQNSWAKNPAIVHVIVKLGSRFCDLYVKRGRYSKCTPADEFPKLISIISEGLKLL